MSRSGVLLTVAAFLWMGGIAAIVLVLWSAAPSRNSAPDRSEGIRSGAGTSSAPGASERHAVPGADTNPFLGACGGCLAGYIFTEERDYVPCPDCPSPPAPPLDDDYVRGAFAAIVALNFSHLINGKKEQQ
jgi:hypothetical protein